MSKHEHIRSSTSSQYQSQSIHGPSHAKSNSENSAIVDSATHIVVEHHHSGTVKTHVFASKDGTPSILGHSIPDLSSCNTHSEVLKDSILSLGTAIQDSFEIARKDFRDNFEALQTSLGSNKCRIASQVSQATTCTIENQIKTTLVPRLDKIEGLLLRDISSSISTRTEGSSDYTSANESSSAARETPSKTETHCHTEFSCFARPFEPNENLLMNYNMILEKLFTIESNIDALCRVVVDGEIPSLPIGDYSEHSSMDNYSPESFDMDAINRLVAMRSDMLGFPELLQDMHTSMKDLAITLTKTQCTNQLPSECKDLSPKEVECDSSQGHDGQDQWQTDMLQVLDIHADGLGGLATNIQSLDALVQNLCTEFSDWRKTHKLTLQVYLKYMFHIYRHTKDTDIQIQQSISEFKNQLAANQASDILTAIDHLPEIIMNRLNISEKDEKDNEDDEDQPSQASNDGLSRKSISTKGDSSLRSRLHRSLSVSTSRHVEHDEGLYQVGQCDTTAISAPSITIPISKQLIEGLVDSIQNLQPAITSLLEKYSGSLVPKHPNPHFASEKSLSSYPNLEKQGRSIDENLTYDPAIQSGSKPGNNIESSSISNISSVMAAIPPASGYIQSVASEEDTANDNTHFQPTSKVAKECSDNEGASATKSLESTGYIQSIDKNLTQLIEAVKKSSEDLKTSQNQLNEKMQDEMHKIFTVIGSLESKISTGIAGNPESMIPAAIFDEERREALERISMIPNLFASLEGVHFHQSNLVTQAINEIVDVKALTANLEDRLVACHNDVFHILQGSMQDSSVINVLRNHMDILMDDNGGRSIDNFLKDQITNMAKTFANIIVTIGDIKDVIEVKHSHQLNIENEVKELQRRYGEDIENTNRMQQEYWRVCNENEKTKSASIQEWHQKHDQNLRDMDMRKQLHRDELQSWHRDYLASLNQLHGEYSRQMEPLWNHRCSCCCSLHQKPSADLTSIPETDGLEGRCVESNSKLRSYSEHDVCSPKNSIRQASNEASTRSKKQASLIDFQSSSTSCNITPENSTFETITKAKSISSAGSNQEPQNNQDIHDSFNSSSPSIERKSIAREYSPYTPDIHNETLPSNIYNLLKLHFQPKEEMNDFGQAKSVETQRAIEELQERNDELTRVCYEKEELINRFMKAMVTKSQEIAAMRCEQESIVQDYEARILVSNQEIDRLQKKMASRKQNLKESYTIISRMYRETLGKDPNPLANTITRELFHNTHPFTNDCESINETVSPAFTNISHFALISQAADQLQQTLEEFKLQKSELHHDIGVLEAKRTNLLLEIATMKEQSLDSKSEYLNLYGLEPNLEGKRSVAGYEDWYSSKSSGDTASLSSANNGQEHQPESPEELYKSDLDAVRQGRNTKKVPRLEADIKINKDGNTSETILSSKTLLTEDQFNRIRSKVSTEGDNEEMWSLLCDFKVRMVDF